MGAGMGGMGGPGGPGGMGQGGPAGAGQGPAGAGGIRKDDPAAGKQALEEARDHSLFSPTKADRGPDYGSERFRLHKNDDLSIYADETEDTYGMDKRTRTCILLCIILVLCFIVALFAPDVLFNGQHTTYSLARWIDDLKTNFEQFSFVVTAQAYTGQMGFKLNQFIICSFAGAGLAVCGAMFQGALKNAMASPSTLGVMTGAQLGSVLYILLGGSTVAFGGVIHMSDLLNTYGRMSVFNYILSTQGQALCSLLGAFVVVALVLLIAHIAGRGKVSKSALIIAGSVFSTSLSAIIQLIRYWLTVEGDAEQVEAVSNIATGTMSATFSLLDVILIGVPVCVCLLCLMMLRSRMNLLSFSDEEAHSMGLSPQASRNFCILVCTVMTAVIVAFCGAVNMLGFLAPLLTRKLIGADFKYLVPASMLLGAIFAILANAITNSYLSGLGMGSVTGMVGMVVFIATLITQRRRRNVDWL